MYSSNTSKLSRIYNSNTIIVLVHGALFICPALVVSLSENPPPDTRLRVFIRLSATLNNLASCVLAILQFCPQSLEFRRTSGSPGSLSLLWLQLRAVAMLAVAVRWFRRFGSPRWEGLDASLTLWCHWGWLPVNYAIEGIGCAVLVGLYQYGGQVSAFASIKDSRS